MARFLRRRTSNIGKAPGRGSHDNARCAEVVPRPPILSIILTIMFTSACGSAVLRGEGRRKWLPFSPAGRGRAGDESRPGAPGCPGGRPHAPGGRLRTRAPGRLVRTVGCSRLPSLLLAARSLARSLSLVGLDPLPVLVLRVRALRGRPRAGMRYHGASDIRRGREARAWARIAVAAGPPCAPS